MLLSIIIPVYNVSEIFLRECLDSILAQTLTDFELILVNDCSPDPSNPQILAEYAAADPRIKVINHTVNLKQSGARNTGMAASEGKYIAFCDGDDLIRADYFQILVELAEKYDADIVSCGYSRFETGGKIIKTRLEPDSVAMPDDDLARAKQFCHRPFAMWGKVYSRRCIEGMESKIDLSLGEDVEFNFRAYLRMQISVSTRKTMYLWRKNLCSITSKATRNDKPITNFVILVRYLLGILKQEQPSGRLGKEMRLYVLTRYCRYASRFRWLNDSKLWRKYCRCYWEELIDLTPEFPLLKKITDNMFRENATTSFLLLLKRHLAFAVAACIRWKIFNLPLKDEAAKK